MSENLLGLWQNNFGSVAKTAFHVTRATFGVNWTFFPKKMQFYSFSRIYRKISTFLESGSASGVKSATFASAETSKEKLDEPGRHSRCPAEPNTSGEKLWQKPKLSDYWPMSDKLPVFWRNMFSGVVNTAFHLSSEKLWGNRVFF